MAYFLPIRFFTALVLFLCYATFTEAVIITLPAQLNVSIFDYVIVGGGTAGLVLASRLSENISTTVAVIEAGVNDQLFSNLQVPLLAPTLTPNTQVDWNTTTQPQPGLNNRTIPYIRGNVLGGSSSINFMFHQYCTMEDWNRLASVSGDSGWGWTNMRQYVAKHEKMVQPADNHSISGQFDSADHGTAGEVSISLPGSNQSIDARVIATTRQLAEFPFNEDTGGGDHGLLGVGFIQSSIGNGTRNSSSTSYLANAIKRPNLLVLLNGTVTMLIRSGTPTVAGEQSFRSLLYTASPPPGNLTLGTTERLTALREIIISAGTVGTAKLLLLSGIGNVTTLSRLKVNATINNPSVGANFSDHLLIPNVFQVNGTGTVDGLLRSTTSSAAALAQWKLNKTGTFSNSIANNYGFTRFPSNSTIFKTTPDPAAGPNSPHWEIIFSNLFFQPGSTIPATGNFLTVVTIPSNPTSRGTVTLKSNNPYDQPLVDPQYMTTDFDVFAVTESIKGALRFVAAPAWSGYVVGPFSKALASATNDSLIEVYGRGIAGSAFHGVGTAAMSPINATNGVVNPDLTLKGPIDGVRIVDASVFPFIPSCHTQGSVYLLAERAADIIKAAQN